MIVKGKTIMYTWEEVLDELYGPIGSPTRIAHDKRMEILERRHESALKAAQTRKRNREEALRLAKEKEQKTQAQNTIEKEQQAQTESKRSPREQANTIEYIVKIETDSRKDDLVQVPLDLLIEQEKHLPLNR